MRLDIYSDTICPWCFIGKRRLDRALAERPQPGLTIHWRAFQLNPEMPAEGMDRQLYLQLKFGGAENAERVYAQVRTAGESEEIPFAFAAMQRTPNTVDSHRLIRFAAGKGLQNEVVEALFEAYFLRGEDIGQPDVLAAAAAGAGLNAGEVRAFLDSDLEDQAVRAEDQEARHAGLQGVPTFIINGKYSVSGAQEPEVLCQMFDIGRGDDAAGGPAERLPTDEPGETGRSEGA
jgi:predicted DsbA family dithiol-disulfide isomerase